MDSSLSVPQHKYDQSIFRKFHKFSFFVFWTEKTAYLMYSFPDSLFHGFSPVDLLLLSILLWFEKEEFQSNHEALTTEAYNNGITKDTVVNFTIRQPIDVSGSLSGNVLSNSNQLLHEALHAEASHLSSFVPQLGYPVLILLVH